MALRCPDKLYKADEPVFNNNIAGNNIKAVCIMPYS